MKLMLALCCLGLSACATFERSSQSGYQDDGSAYATESADLYRQKQMNQERDVREELGLLGRPLTEDERSTLEARMQLKRQESKIQTKREKKQYYNVRSHLKNDRERSYFLSLPTFEARERWAQQRGLGNHEEGHSAEVAKVIESNDIALGMSQKAVSESWGDPDVIETAGNALYSYERWKYNRYVSGNEGYQKELRVVYFEGGRVVGWERM